MSIILVGLSHKTAPVRIRERVAFAKEELPRALDQLSGLRGISAGLILSTCNRVELLAEAACEEEGVAALKEFLHDYHAMEYGELDPFLYEFTAGAAIRHTFRVACGLDSLVIGETQILGQIKDAYYAAVQSGCLRGMLNQLMLETFRVTKRVRSETRISTAGASISRAAVELARKVFGELREQTILVIGAGKMSELTASHLCRSGALKVLVTNRTYERAAGIAARFQGEAVPFEDLFKALARADIVISSISSPSGYLVHRADVQCALEERKNRSMLFIDIAVPRNVEPSVTDVENAFLYDIDDLQSHVASHRGEAAETIQAAEEMVESEVDTFAIRQQYREIGPIIANLKDRIQSISCAELERHIRKLTIASPEDRQTLEVMVKRIANKILHPLIVQLKRQVSPFPHDAGYVETLALAFRSNGESSVDHETINS
jgi:glutamyl-tRNA reductase